MTGSFDDFLVHVGDERGDSSYEKRKQKTLSCVVLLERKLML